MKPFSTLGKVGVVLLLLNEIRGILVVISVLSAWSHAGKAAAPPSPCPPAHQFAGLACRAAGLARKPKPAATAPAQPSGSSGAIIRPQ